jgi:hypothetical protein
MEIKLNSWDINEAIKNYVKDKYNLDVDFEEMDEYPCLEYSKREIVHKKYKNGKVKKDKNGMWIIDEEKTKYVTEFAEIGNDSAIVFYLW